MVNKTEPVIVIVIISLLLSFGFIFAAKIINSPVPLGNYSSAFNISCNVSDNVANNNRTVYNVSVYYNASGGSTANATLLFTQNNASAIQYVFENTTTNISSLADGVGYNISCFVANGTELTQESQNITIDRTAPNVSGFVGSNGTTYNATDYGNYSNGADGNLLAINVSVSDATVGMFFGVVDYNITYENGTQKNFTRAINIGNVSYYYAINISDFADGTYYIFAWANDTLGNMNDTENITVKFDSTAPVVTFNTGALGNFSGSVVLNATVTDATIGVGDVYFNISNYTKNQYNFTKASKEGNSYNISLSTVYFPDGNYTLTLYSNDTTVGNQNNSEQINFTIDNTAPNTPSFACTDQVYVGNTVTCTCSGTDGATGVNETVFTVNPTTSETGTFIVTCTTFDRAGNSKSVTETYIVEQQGSSGGGGGGSGSTTFKYTRTISRLDQEFSEIKTINEELREKQRVRIKINDETHHVGVRKITATSATIEISSDPVQIVLDIGEDAKVDINDDNFYDIYVKLNSIVNGYADLTINYINEEIPKPEEGETSPVDTTGEIVEPEVENTGISIWVWVVVIIIVIVIIVVFAAMKKRSGLQKK